MKKLILSILTLSQTFLLSAGSYVPKKGEIQFTVYQTTRDRAVHEVLTTPFTKHLYPALTPIDLDTATPTHDYLGCGISLTDASCWLLSRMTEEQRQDFYAKAFSKQGANLNIFRLNCGASDYATELYNYNDCAGDVEMKHFSIERDELYMIPVIKEALAYRPDAFIFSSVWSVPGWMKDAGNMVGGHQLDEYLPAVANYWTAYLKAYRDRGIHVDVITPQNEPETDQLCGAPATLLSADQETKLVTELFPKAFRKAGLDTKVWLLDHNYNHYKRVLSQLENPSVRRHIDAIAWHPYGGRPEMADTVHRKYPEIPMHLTERGPNAVLNNGQTHHWWCGVIFDALNAGCSSYTGWNLLLDEDGQPNTGKSPCMGLFTVDSQTGGITTSVQYEVFHQFCPYVERGAKILSYSGPDDKWLKSIVFQNPNGDYVIVLSDDASSHYRDRVEIKFMDQYLHLTLPLNTWSLTTIVIKGDQKK